MDSSLPPLAGPELAKLTACEASIERGLQRFYDVGAALLEIRDQRL
jgi:hypothetical protein